jgi:hypothetical protein
MFPPVRSFGGIPSTGLALAFGIWALAGSSALGQGNVGPGASGGITGAAGGGSASAGIGGGLMGGLTNPALSGFSGLGGGGWGGMGSPYSTPAYAYGGSGYGAYGMAPGGYGMPYVGGVYGGGGYAGPVYTGGGYVCPGYGAFGIACDERGACYPVSYGCNHHGYPKVTRVPHGLLGQLSFHNWCSDLCGKECLDPYWASPYGPPGSGYSFPPFYSAPPLTTSNAAAPSR